MITLTDLFCGAGGSSTGAVQVPNVEVKVAANHWNLAIDTHAANHPETDHRCADLSQVDPRMFPRTTMGWFSPSCTKHSIAQGLKRQDAQPDLFGEVLPDEAAERSRATMWDVVRFSEYHRYEIVIVENVVDVYDWPPFQSWLMAMESIGYQHRILYVNSMHAHVYGQGAPQSRDRIYITFWRAGNAAPDLERIVRPEALCGTCGPVRAMQVWKRQDRAPWGRYRAQYVYRCPSVKCRNQIVEPTYRPAAEIIDWSLLGQRIGDRAKPLAAKTVARIEAGIEKYWAPLLVPVEGREGKRAVTVEHPIRTMTARNETGLAFLTQFRDRVRDIDPQREPLPTVVADGANHGLVAHPFIAELRGGGSKHRSVNAPLATVTASGNHHGLVTTYYGNGGVQPAGESLATVTTVERHALLTGPTVNLDDVLFRMLEPREMKRAMDFPTEYVMKGNRREQSRLAGNAVCPPNARDLIGVVAESLGAA